MLHHLAFLSPFSSPFNHSPPLPPPVQLQSEDFGLLLEGKQGRMDSLKTPFKAGIRSEFSPSSMPHHHLNQTLLVSDEEWATEITGLVGDDFSVEDLLDMGAILEEVEFHPELEAREEEEEAEQEEGEEQEHRTQEEETNSSSGLSFEGLPATELLLPEGDISDLEWVSHFVEDCFSEFPTSAVSFPYHHLNSKPETLEALETHKPSSPSSSCLKRTMDKLAVPVKVRSKRSKTGGRVWSLLAPQLAEPTSSSSSSSSSSASSSSALSSSLVHENRNRDLSLYCMKPPKKKGRKPKAAAGWTEGGGGGCAPWQRRCSHCGVQKTPQWRTGPLGAKTLCNACGVRYKSGRLVPEYRPAGSPTFLSHVHSNSHRKVLEMRRKKEELAPAPSTPIPRPPVHDCESLPSEQQRTEPVRPGPTGCSFGLV